MAARTTLATLIARVRRLIGDPVSASQEFSDDEIQATLDGTYRRDLTGYPLTPVASYAPGLVYLAYEAGDLAPWEDDATLQSGSYATISNTGYTAAPLVGRWVFAASQQPPVYATGRVFDLHGAAGDLLDQWASKESLSFDFQAAEGQDFKRSQKAKLLREAAAAQRALAWPRQACASRDDETTAGAGRVGDSGLPWGYAYGGRR